MADELLSAGSQSAGLTLKSKFILIMGMGAVALFFGMFLGPGIAQHYGISIDPQYQSCLPWSHFLVQYGPTDPKPGELVLFHDRKIDIISGGKKIEVIKMVAAVPGDRVKIKPDSLWIAGPSGPYRYWGKRWLMPWVHDKHLKVLPPETITIPKGKYLLMGVTPGSYDGRYWGLVPAKNITGKAWAL
jgi:signal peptidase I, bacterial type